ncbi:hypothetical protein B6N60_05081 [Richelia sinica FACHB-800]|uniref:DUF732 domain-containing protein n=1 Tax=Richelia sinica FACHB-800 TaxID=1357546 RepID=A0A975TCQ5_9NOST|nr:hypothetical protein B6N60_05081 [Richelia sinica FACHB-800]
MPQAALSESGNSTANAARDFLCYMQRSDGQVINLTKLCGIKKNPVLKSTISSTDQQFLQQYKFFLKKRLGGSPLISSALSQAESSPENVVKRARGICGVIQSRDSANLDAISRNIDADLMNTMAVEYYCPELDD